MSTYNDLQLLSDAAYYDRCNYVNYNVDNVLKETDKIKDAIYHAKAGSRDVPLLKYLWQMNVTMIVHTVPIVGDTSTRGQD